MLFNWMAMLMTHMAIVEMTEMVIMATIAMAIGNFSIAIRVIQLKSIKKLAHTYNIKMLIV